MAVVLIASIPLMLILDRADPAVASAIIIGLLVLLGVVEGVVRLPDWLRQSQVGTPPPPPLKEEDDA